MNLARYLPHRSSSRMDRDDFLAALQLCLADPWRHFNVACVWRTAEELGQQRRTVTPATR